MLSIGTVVVRSGVNQIIKSGCGQIGRTRFLRLWLLLALCFGVAQQGLANEPPSLNEIAQLSRGGASELALRLLAQGEPELARQPTEWMRWERLRLRIMEQREDWQGMVARLETLPPGLPDEFVEWARLRLAVALLHVGEYEASRQVLRGLIWQGEPPTATRLAEYRQWLIQGYLREGRDADALAAMLRFQQDYGDRDPAVQRLRARVLLASGRAADARLVLEQLPDEAEVVLLRQLARLRAGTPGETVLKALAALDEASIAGHEVLRHGIAVEAAAAPSQLPARILALQAYLSLPPAQLTEETLFNWDGDALWAAWLAYATELGNREQLLIGDDQAWAKAARETSVRFPVRQRSLQAMLAQRGSQEEARSEAHRQLLGLLRAEDSEEGMRLLQQLYLHAPGHIARGRIPEVVAYPLVDQAIRSGDLRRAAGLMQQLSEPPGETARFAWQLRRGKVFILAGDYQALDLLLNELLTQLARLSASQRDQLVQLGLDLQNVARHEHAYEWFDTLYQAIPNHALRRELLFWMADSRSAMGQHAEAARLYLQSATLGDLNSMDPWAQTARYQAANSLAKGELLEDAAFIYRQLLRVTENAERRSVLMRELEQVQMRLAARSH